MAFFEMSFMANKVILNKINVFPLLFDLFFMVKWVVSLYFNNCHYWLQVPFITFSTIHCLEDGSFGPVPFFLYSTRSLERQRSITKSIYVPSFFILKFVSMLSEASADDLMRCGTHHLWEQA
ncbi:hypothetical protein BDC45DRAFT_542126 [Circinella umbellata]|nr:hypothetical protein BDC45DRAFT_542126 [Circinella umbellata]